MHLRTLLAGTAALLTLGTCTNVQAATVTVPDSSVAGLVAAINAANATPEADTLNVSGTYSFTTADNWWYGPNALPAITSDITIQGDAARGAVLANTNGSRLRIFYVADTRSGLSAGTLTLRNLELRNGRALGGSSAFGGGGAGLGGAIYNQGTLALSGVTFAGNTATGGSAFNVNSTSGGGMGADGTLAGGGGFGGAVTGGGSGGAGAAATAGGGGGGGGYGAADNGANGTNPGGGRGGGTSDGLGGASQGVKGGAGSGAGGTAVVGSGDGGNGGRLGVGGSVGTAPAGSNLGGGGGGGVGGGGGGAGPGSGGGGGGFGGGGGWSNIISGNGGFGGGGAGDDGRNAGATPGKGGYGGGDGGPFIANSVSVGGGGAGMGGAIFNDRGTVTATNSTFSGNAVTGGISDSRAIGGTVNAGQGGSALGAAIFNLNGSLTLAHVTIAGNSATAGTGATNGIAQGSVVTLGLDSNPGTPRSASANIRQSIVTAVGGRAVWTDNPATVPDGTANFATASSNADTTGPDDPQLAPLGDYGGPTRTMAPNPGSPVIGAGTRTDLTTVDQRGFTRVAPYDLGAVETVATTVTVSNVTLPFSPGAQNAGVSAGISPARATSSPGSVTFTLGGGLGSGAAAISGGTASRNLPIAGGTAAGDYTITADAAAAPGFAAGSGTATLHVKQAPQVCADTSATTGEGDRVDVAPSCTGGTPAAPAVVADPAHGTAVVAGGALRYTPADGYFGSDSFTYKTTNEGGDSNVARVSVTVTALKPTCHAVAVTASAGIGKAITLDCDSEIAQDYALGLTAPAHGRLSAFSDDGHVTYTADDDYAGPDSFTYRSTNSSGTASEATVTIDVKARPVLTATRGHAVIAGRYNPVAGSTITFKVYDHSDCTGTVVHSEAVAPDDGGVADTAWVPTTPGDYGWQATYSGDANNLGATSECTSQTIIAPQVCADVSGSTLEGDAVDVAPDCTGPTPATVAIAGAPGHGSATLAGGLLHYTPDAGFFGTDTFTYKSTNGGGDSNAARVTITVAPFAPTCRAVTAVASAGLDRTIALDCTSEVAQTFTVVSGPAHGTLGAVGADGKVVYKAADDYAGPDSFTYMSQNATGKSHVATVTLDVKARPVLTATRGHAVIAGRYSPVAGSTITFRVYNDASCTGTVVHAESGEPDAASGAADITFAPTAPGSYGWQASYSGDANNLAATSACEAQTIGTPVASQSVPVPAECGTPVTLLDVSPVGGRARVSGVAHRALAGKAVTILRAGKPVGTATVGADGAFSALVGGPAKGEATPVKYTVLSGRDTSRAFRYDRMVRIVKRSGLTVSGRLAAKLRVSRVTVYRENVCTGARAASTAKVSKKGAFSFTMKRPDTGSPYALYRVYAKVGGGRSFSTEVAVTG